MIWRLGWPRIWRADGFKFQSKSKSKGRRIRGSQLEDRQREHILLCLAFCSLQATTRFRRTICFTHTNSKVNLI